MSLEKILEHFGGVAQAARALGVSRQTIYNWIERGDLPHHRRAQAEAIINAR